MSGYLTAIGFATRPYRDYLAALGVAKGGDPKGISVVGVVYGTAASMVRATIHQPEHTCRGSGPAQGGELVLTVRRGLLRAGGLSLGSLRTRCPGPFAPTYGALVTGKAARSTYSRRAFELRLRGRSFRDAGYTADVSGQILVRFTRGRITQETFG
jgi:hypothetical protein